MEEGVLQQTVRRKLKETCKEGIMMKCFAYVFLVMLVFGCTKDPEAYSHKKKKSKYSFQLLNRVVLHYTDSMFVGRMYSFAVFSDGKLSIGDNLDSKVKIYSSDGKFVKSISTKGSGPGETRNLQWHCIDESDRVWISDYGLRRVSVYDTSGSVLGMWYPLEDCDNCHFRNKIRVLSNKIYLALSRAETNPVKAKHISSLVTAFDFHYTRIVEYGKYDHNVEEYSVEPTYVFDVDSIGNFYLAHDFSNIVWKSSADGKSIKGFYYPVDQFRPIKNLPPRSGGRKEWARWFSSTTAIGALEIVGGYVFVSFANRDLEYSTSYDIRYSHEYLQVFDLDGNCLVDHLISPGKFLSSDNAGVLYFLEEEEPERMVISKYRFAEE